MATQAERKARFEAFSFDEDARWATYRSNLEIPPGRNESAVLLKYKQKWYKQNIDPGFEIEAPRATTSATPPPSAAPRPNYGAPRPPTSTGASGSRSTPSTAPPGRYDADTILFLLHALVVVMAVFHLIPFLSRYISLRAYRFCFLGAVGSHVYSIKLKYGLPRELSLNAIRNYVATVGRSSDFLFSLYSLLFLTSWQPAKLVVLPVGANALMEVCLHLQRHFGRTDLYKKYLETGCLWVIRNSHLVQGFIAQSEISIGFMLAFLLLTPQRNLLQLMMMWQLLKLKYHLPPSATYHRQLWGVIGQKVAPILARVPILNRPIGFIQNWFMRLQ